MEEQSIEYTIDIVDNVEFDVSKEPRFENDTNPIVIYYWKYIVLNNIGYPTTTIKAQVGKQGTYDNPPELPNPFVDIPLYGVFSIVIVKFSYKKGRFVICRGP